VLALVELGPLRDLLVGAPGGTGLSLEQRKRLTIAVELVANPAALFLDEPTTGARGAGPPLRPRPPPHERVRCMWATLLLGRGQPVYGQSGLNDLGMCAAGRLRGLCGELALTLLTLPQAWTRARRRW
jgi:hypothetical protein